MVTELVQHNDCHFKQYASLETAESAYQKNECDQNQPNFKDLNKALLNKNLKPLFHRTERNFGKKYS